MDRRNGNEKTQTFDNSEIRERDSSSVSRGNAVPRTNSADNLNRASVNPPRQLNSSMHGNMSDKSLPYMSSGNGVPHSQIPVNRSGENLRRVLQSESQKRVSSDISQNAQRVAKPAGSNGINKSANDIKRPMIGRTDVGSNNSNNNIRSGEFRNQGIQRKVGNNNAVPTEQRKPAVSSNAVPNAKINAGQSALNRTSVHSNSVPPNSNANVRSSSSVRVPSRGNVQRPPIQKNNLYKNQNTVQDKKTSVQFDDDYAYEDYGGVSSAAGGALSSILKAIIYIVFVLVVSGALSYFGITVCNDVFAFIKDTNEVVVTIPEYATLNDIASILKENRVIKYPYIFKIYAQLRDDDGEFLSGEYTISPSMSYDYLLSAFKPVEPPRKEVSVTIPEGYTVDEIIDHFVSLGMGTREGFIDAIENYDWDYWFIDELESNINDSRKYKLEGYLFPDTYYYYSDSSEVVIIWKMLENFEVKFPQELRERCTELGYTVDEVLTIASMIQMEAKYPSEFPYVSAVFHNRLNNPNNETQGRLQSDPTIQYALGGHEILTQENLEMDSPYNTYIYKGLPPGPICNPDLNAINYALYPEEVDYLYFVAKKDGYHLFASNLDDHNQNIFAADRER